MNQQQRLQMNQKSQLTVAKENHEAFAQNKLLVTIWLSF